MAKPGLGAWQSGVFETERDQQKPLQEAQVGKPPVQGAQVGTSPGMYNAPVNAKRAKTNDRGTYRTLSLWLRIAQIVLTLVAAAIMVTNKQDTTYYSSYDSSYSESGSTIDFSSVNAFMALAAVNGLVCIYAIVQLVHSIVKKTSSASTGFALLTFMFDSVLAYVLVATAAAAAGTAALMTADESIKKFTLKALASVAVSFLAFAVLAASAALYPKRLRKLASS